jgi:chromosomal replication initiation ATPase DnaA
MWESSTEHSFRFFRVANNALPAAFAIHQALKTELKVENRIGATFGKVYCGVVGGVRRHEFAVMGAPVNLAARLMGSKVNRGILVDEAVREQAGNRFLFNSLPPVQAKGYDKPVPILEPMNAVSTNKKKKSSYPFVGRNEEKSSISSVAEVMLKDPMNSHSSVVFLIGESGTGKSALAAAVVDEIKHTKREEDPKIIASARSTSSETEQRIPLR